MFVSDLVLDRPEVTDVSHAVVAVGSRDKAKAAKFIEEHCPKGACAQVKGIHNAPPQAYGSYDEVFAHPVSAVLRARHGSGKLRRDTHCQS